jgi:tetratricopeptide (TPR) repeat protein
MLQPPREIMPAEAMNNNRLAKRVLFIGWDGVDFPRLLPLMQSGHLPNLGALLDQGASVELSAPRPVLSQAAWTSLATGRRPHEHGILHADVPKSDGSTLFPIGRHQRQCPAIWNILNRVGLRTHVVGWPVTHPVESLSGICISDRFAMPVAGKPLMSHVEEAVSPPTAESILRGLRVAPSQIEEMTLSQLLPHDAVCLPEFPTLAAICRAILAETATLFRALRWCLKQQPWDFAACVFPGIRSCHELARWMQGISPAVAEYSERLLTGCYEHYDLLLGQITPLIGRDSHVIAVSLAQQSTATMEPHDDEIAPPRTGIAVRTMGMAVVSGPSVRHATVPSSRSVLDLAPTICAMLDVPYSSDPTRCCWQDLFTVDQQSKIVQQREAYTIPQPVEASERPTVPTDGDVAVGRILDQSVEHLVKLGYVDPHDLASQEAVDKCRRSTQLNRAISLVDAGLLDEAVVCLEQVVREHSDWFNARATLAEAYFRARRWRSASDEIDWLMCRGCEGRSLYLLAAAVDLARRQFDAALEELRCAGRAGIYLPGSQALEGEIQLRKQDLAAAELAFRSSIERDGPTLQALDGLACVHLHAGRYEEAAVNALDALAQEMGFGRAHYHLAVALLHLDKPYEAVRALESWAAVEPFAAAPFRWLTRVYEQRLDDPPRAAASRAEGREVVRRRRAFKSSRAVGASTPSSAP